MPTMHFEEPLANAQVDDAHHAPRPPDVIQCQSPLGGPA